MPMDVLIQQAIKLRFQFLQHTPITASRELQLIQKENILVLRYLEHMKTPLFHMDQFNRGFGTLEMETNLF